MIELIYNFKKKKSPNFFSRDGLRKTSLGTWLNIRIIFFYRRNNLWKYHPMRLVDDIWKKNWKKDWKRIEVWGEIVSIEACIYHSPHRTVKC